MRITCLLNGLNLSSRLATKWQNRSMKETFSEFKIEDYLTTNELRQAYLNQVLVDGDLDELERALFHIVSSYGINSFEKKANLNRESLCKIIRALDIKLDCI